MLFNYICRTCRQGYSELCENGLKRMDPVSDWQLIFRIPMHLKMVQMLLMLTFDILYALLINMN